MTDEETPPAKGRKVFLNDPNQRLADQGKAIPTAEDTLAYEPQQPTDKTRPHKATIPPAPGLTGQQLGETETEAHLPSPEDDTQKAPPEK